MGIFHEQIQIVNRAPIALNVRFDGQDMNIPVGQSVIPRLVVEYAKRQNVIMGSADPDNPSMSGASYLIGVVGQDNCEPLSPEDWAAHEGKPCRLDLEILADDRLNHGEHFETRSKGRRTQAKSRGDSGVAVSAPILEIDQA